MHGLQLDYGDVLLVRVPLKSFQKLDLVQDKDARQLSGT